MADAETTTEPTVARDCPTDDGRPRSENPIAFDFQVLGGLMDSFPELDQYQAPKEYAAFLSAAGEAAAPYVDGDHPAKTPLIRLSMAAHEWANRMYLNGFEVGIVVENLRRALVGPARLCPYAMGRGASTATRASGATERARSAQRRRFGSRANALRGPSHSGTASGFGSGPFGAACVSVTPPV